MPKELKTKEEFDRLVEGATELRVVRRGDSAKMKLRTADGLFTFKTTVAEADSMVKGVKAPVVEY